MVEEMRVTLKANAEKLAMWIKTTDSDDNFRLNGLTKLVLINAQYTAILELSLDDIKDMPDHQIVEFLSGLKTQIDNFSSDLCSIEQEIKREAA